VERRDRTGYVLRGANHLWASFGGPSLLTQYAPQVIWCFFAGFAALSIPWPLPVWYLRRVGRREEAHSIQDAADSKVGFDSFKIMKWLSIGLVAPIAVVTLLAVPIHLSITDSEVRVGHYASFLTEIFPLNDARLRPGGRTSPKMRALHVLGDHRSTLAKPRSTITRDLK
jgi:hypothetical protein